MCCVERKEKKKKKMMILNNIPNRVNVPSPLNTSDKPAASTKLTKVEKSVLAAPISYMVGGQHSSSASLTVEQMESSEVSVAAYSCAWRQVVASSTGKTSVGSAIPEGQKLHAVEAAAVVVAVWSCRFLMPWIRRRCSGSDGC